MGNKKQVANSCFLLPPAGLRLFRSCAFFPGVEVFNLFWGEGVNFNAH
jgi:hypothetical protein